MTSPTSPKAAPVHPLQMPQLAHPDEREFVNWICSQGGGRTAIHLHTEATLRHGLTLLQRVSALRTTSQNAGARGQFPLSSCAHGLDPQTGPASAHKCCHSAEAFGIISPL
jgi:hypothetical protein